jgi:COPI associated protein
MCHFLNPESISHTHRVADCFSSIPCIVNTHLYRNKARCVIFALSMLNIGLAAMMGTLGVLSLIAYSPNGVDDISLAFLSCYMIIFAALLFLYEFIWWQPVPSLNITFRKNFGFLYGLKGKGFYLIFIAFLTLGIRKNGGNRSGVKGLDLWTGAAWLLAGALHLFVACYMPETAAVYKPPTAGLATLGQSDPNASALPTTTSTGAGMTDINPI